MDGGVDDEVWPVLSSDDTIRALHLFLRKICSGVTVLQRTPVILFLWKLNIASSPAPRTHKQRVWEGNPLQGRDGLAWRGEAGHGGLGHGVRRNLVKLVHHVCCRHSPMEILDDIWNLQIEGLLRQGRRCWGQWHSKPERKKKYMFKVCCLLVFLVKLVYWSLKLLLFSRFTNQIMQLPQLHHLQPEQSQVFLNILATNPQ